MVLPIRVILFNVNDRIAVRYLMYDIDEAFYVFCYERLLCFSVSIQLAFNTVCLTVLYLPSANFPLLLTPRKATLPTFGNNRINLIYLNKMLFPNPNGFIMVTRDIWK